jgi:hypothetical protein
MKNYLIVFTILAIVGFIRVRSAGNYRYTLENDPNLYIEVYRTGIIGNQTSEYLTDSVNFRVYLGTVDKKTGDIDCKLNGDHVIIEKRERDGKRPTDPLSVVERKAYSLNYLKKHHNFY